MKKYCLAVDIGASSGRLILAYLEQRQLKLTEIYRFDNNMIEKNGHLCWDIESLFSEIKIGIKKCKEHGVKPDSVGIDTWAVDFLLLDENDNLLTDAVAYRDRRTEGVMEQVFEKIDKEHIYQETGIQFLQFNTIYQICALKQSNPEVLQKAKTFLMIPDYFNYLLTGKKANEYTNATSTQLVNAVAKNWDTNMLEKLDINREMFQEIKMPKNVLGNLTKELVEEFGFNMSVILPATHDTGSAVIAVPEANDTIYISSGTWSLIGVENSNPICNSKALKYNYTNEGGMDYRFRFLKNIMGLWMIQEVRRNYDNRYSFADLVDLTKNIKCISVVNVNDSRFLKPENMIKAIQSYCQETAQQIPLLPGEVAKCVFDSLANSYHEAVVEIEDIFGKEYKQINVIGGGCQNELLNQLIANVTKKEVYAGPIEATAIGNLVSQFIAIGEIKDIDEARSIIKRSFEIKKYVHSKSDVN